MKRLTRKDRNDSGTGISKESLIDRGRNGLSDYASRILTKLADYEDAEEQGLLIRLPCKVGDTVYQIAGYCWDCYKQTNYCHHDCKEPKYRIREFAVNHFEVDSRNIEIHGRLGCSGILGKTIFLTREEAEEALERMG